MTYQSAACVDISCVQSWPSIEVIQQVLEWLSVIEAELSHECLQLGLKQAKLCGGKLNSLNDAEEN